MTTRVTHQEASAGKSSDAIVDAVLQAARPQPGLSWLDIGCGTGDLLRRIRDETTPSRLIGVDIIDWLDDDLGGDVEMHVGSAESVLPEIEPADRVLLVETIEHLYAPWSVAAAAARLLSPGGVLVISTPSISTLRHRLELLVRGRLTAFRVDNLPHLTPALPHVTERILHDEGLDCSRSYAGADVIPLTGGRIWPEGIRRRAPELLSTSVLVAGARNAPAAP